MDKICFPGNTTRRERRKLEMQERLLGAATGLFAEQGCDFTSVEQICARADMARKTFYNYFPSKEHLIYVLSEQLIFNESRRLLEEARTCSADGIRQLRFYLDRTAAHLRRFEQLERELIRQTIKDIAHHDERVAERYPHLRNLLCALIAGGQAHGDMRTDFRAELLAQIVSSAIDAVTVSWVYDESYPIEQHMAELADYFAVTLAKSAGPGARRAAAPAASLDAL
jgi:AcrR family transcriptional regulator